MLAGQSTGKARAGRLQTRLDRCMIITAEEGAKRHGLPWHGAFASSIYAATMVPPFGADRRDMSEFST